MNEDLKKQPIGRYFHQIPQAGQEAPAMFTRATSANYQRRLTQLHRLRDVCPF
ncbi:hypothetical protein [Hymenobacter crusticola]|uniref:hypothetical protein n=1 Tax=Hymenobacter crusticola TaxID=1770526 RepID=UPI0015C4EED9|nr:hypothetical protein [Hymenobacter crusticola]